MNLSLNWKVPKQLAGLITKYRQSDFKKGL